MKKVALICTTSAIRNLGHTTLTVKVSKGTESSPGAVAILLDVVALGRLVDLRVELLLGTGVAILACVTILTIARLPPLIPVLHIWTGR